MFSFVIVFLSIVDASIIRFLAIQFIEYELTTLITIFGFISCTIIMALIVFSKTNKINLDNFQKISLDKLLLTKNFKYAQIVLILLILISLVFVIIQDYRYVLLYLIIILVHIESIVFFVWALLQFTKWVFGVRNKILVPYIISFIVFTLFIFISLSNYVSNLDNLYEDVKYVPYYYSVYTISLSLSHAYFMDLNFLLSFLSFLSMWITTTILLHQYIKKSNKKYFWVLITLPLIYYTGQFLFIEIDYLTTMLLIDPINNLLAYEFLFLLSYPLVGVIFGMTILFIARKIENKSVKTNLHFLSIGFMLLFCSFQSNSILYMPFPPFGISIALMALGSFLIVVNLYQIVFTLSKNIAIYREVVKIIGDKNFIIHLTEGKKLHELDKVINQVNKSVSQSYFYEQDISENLSKEDINDILTFISEELKGKGSNVSNPL